MSYNTKAIYDAIKRQQPSDVLLLQDGDNYIAYGPDAEIVLSVCPGAKRDGDVAVIPAGQRDNVVNALLAAGLMCNIAEFEKQIPMTAEVERIVTESGLLEA